jgi:hypothetical protein
MDRANQMITQGATRSGLLLLHHIKVLPGELAREYPNLLVMNIQDLLDLLRTKSLGKVLNAMRNARVFTREHRQHG